jgi:hypothetical protein
MEDLVKPQLLGRVSRPNEMVGRTKLFQLAIP